MRSVFYTLGKYRCHSKFFYFNIVTVRGYMLLIFFKILTHWHSKRLKYKYSWHELKLGKKQNPLHEHRGPFASPGLDEAEVTCSNIWLLQEIQVILFNDLELEMYCSFHLSLAISVEHRTGLEMKLKNDRITASQAGGKDIWAKGGLESCCCALWSLWMCQDGSGTASVELCWGVTLKQPFTPTPGNKMWM